MFARLFRRAPETNAIAAELYGAIVAQARNPALYAGLGVADTLDGRFEMVVLHTVLVLDRVERERGADRILGQQVFDLYCLDMDRSLRELGVGDLGVPKRMKVMAERFYGRAAAYRAALADDDVAALTDSLARNVFGAAPGEAGPLARYVMASHQSLAATSTAELHSGSIRFADPAAFAPARANQ